MPGQVIGSTMITYRLCDGTSDRKSWSDPKITGKWSLTCGNVGAGDGNRTRVASLEDWGSTIELRPRGG